MCTDQPGISGRLTKAPVISRELDNLQLLRCAAACSGHPQPLQPEGCAHRGQASPRSSRCGGAVSCSSRGLHCLGTDHPPLADKWSNGFSATAWRGGGAELQNVEVSALSRRGALVRMDGGGRVCPARRRHIYSGRTSSATKSSLMVGGRARARPGPGVVHATTRGRQIARVRPYAYMQARLS